MINMAILGFGNIGGGVAEVLERNQNRIREALGDMVCVKYVLDRRDLTGSPYADRAVRELDVILSDPSVSIVCETLGGSHPAYEFSLAALQAGKSVVTSNKEVVARYGSALLAAAEENGVHYYYEAAVGGAIPILTALDGALKGSAITRIDGILNGTTNYILTRMHDCGTSFADALGEAQRLGYAEVDPTADVSGADTCRKICILAAAVWGSLVPKEEVFCEGITALTAAHNDFAAKCGGAIKLVATAEKVGEALALSVMPCVVLSSCPLSAANDVFNAVKVDASDMGELLFYGMGAGKRPTASAIISDVLSIVKKGKNVDTTRRFAENTRELIGVDDVKADYCVELVCDKEVLAEKLADYCVLREEVGTLYVLCENISKNDLLAALADVKVQMLMKAIA